MATEFVHRRGPATSSPTRSAPNERIDGISALVKALARALLRDSSRSPYGDGRSMLIPEWGQFIRPGSGTSEPGYSHPLSDCEHGIGPMAIGQMSQQLRQQGLYRPMNFRTTAQSFSLAIIELDATMRSGRLRHDGNPVLEGCVGNVISKADRSGNRDPTRSRPDQKIEAAVALMKAIDRAMVGDEDAKRLEGFLTSPILG